MAPVVGRERGADTDMPDHPIPRIVVGVDGSPEAQTALRWAVAEATRRQGLLHLVIASWHALWIRYVMIPLEGRPGSASMILDAAASYAHALAPDLPIEREVVTEPPATTLINVSEGATLLVLGRSSHRSPGATHHGASVARECSRHAHCPVVVVPSLPQSC